MWFFFFQAEDGIRDVAVTGVQTCALPIWKVRRLRRALQSRSNSEAVRRVIDERLAAEAGLQRSEEGRGGEEGRSRWAADHLKKKKKRKGRGEETTETKIKQVEEHGSSRRQ